MRKHIELFNAFIAEQKAFFEQKLATEFIQHWDDAFWTSGIKGTGWLRGNGKQVLRFDEIKRFTLRVSRANRPSTINITLIL